LEHFILLVDGARDGKNTKNHQNWKKSGAPLCDDRALPGGPVIHKMLKYGYFGDEKTPSE
jgi:hypothetical protein